MLQRLSLWLPLSRVAPALVPKRNAEPFNRARTFTPHPHSEPSFRTLTPTLTPNPHPNQVPTLLRALRGVTVAQPEQAA